MTSRRLVAVTALFVVAQQGSISAQPPALVVESVQSDRQVVASDAGFINSLKLFARQWRLGKRPDDIVMPVYRLDTLGGDSQQLILESLARSAADSSVPAVFLTRPAPGGDFLGKEVAIRVPSQHASDVQDPWSYFLRSGRARLQVEGDDGGDGLYLALSQAVEDLEPDTDVVIFESDFQSRP